MTETTVPEGGQRRDDERDAESPCSTLNLANGTGEKPATAAPDASPPPNGGLEAWSQVVGSFFLFFNSWYALSPTSLPSSPCHKGSVESMLIHVYTI